VAQPATNGLQIDAVVTRWRAILRITGMDGLTFIVLEHPL
jgi:hypothetical protein